MKRRTFYATFLLFLAVLYGGVLALSLIMLHGTTRQAKEQCLNEQYFLAAAIHGDLAALEGRGVAADVEELMQPYLYLAGNRGAVLALYEKDRLAAAVGTPVASAAASRRREGETRAVSLERDGARYWCSAVGSLPEPFGAYTVLYQTDVTQRIGEWRQRNHWMLLAGGGASLVLALFLLLLLDRLFRPLAQITRLSGQIAAGDYAVRLPETGKDELAQMARSFNHMAEEVAGKVAELAAAAENRQRFVENFAHELRTPLTAVYGYAEYMQKAALGEEDARFALEAILSESRRMQQMANQLMELSNLRSGEIRMERQDVAQLLEAARRTLDQKLRQKSLRLRVLCQADTVRGDKVLLQSLLVNLLDNAVKASGEGGEIVLAAQKREGNVVLSVTDRGAGMAPEELARITEPYYRVDRARSRRDGGAGLGLALCRQIAQRHGAALTFQSEPGRGTTAAVTFYENLTTS